MNSLIFIAIILDPQYKLKFLEISFNQMYRHLGDGVRRSLFICIKSDLHLLFDDYVSTYASSTASKPSSGSQSIHTTQSGVVTELPTYGNTMSLKARFKKHKQESRMGGNKKSELEIYLSEAVVEDEGAFDILRWWKLNSERFPILSRMARDVLANSVSNMASKSCFSTFGHVLDFFGVP